MLDFLYQSDYYFWETWLRENSAKVTGEPKDET